MSDTTTRTRPDAGQGPATESSELVLVVDDDAGMRSTIVDILMANEITAAAVASGRAARELAADTQVAAVVVDQRLPDTTGIDLCASLKDLDPEIQAILLTGYATLETAIAAVGHLDEFLTKPVPPDQLVRVVRSALSRRRLRIENALLVEQLSRANTELASGVEVRTRDLSGLTAMAEGVAAAADLAAVTDAVVRTVARATDAAGTAVYLQDEPGVLELAAAGGGFPLPARFRSWADARHGLERMEVDAGRVVVAELVVAGERVGVLAVMGPRPDSAQLVSALAAQAALAVQNAQRLDRERETVERLSELARMKSAFLASVSHELRTPLAAVVGFAEILEYRWDQLPEPERGHILGRMVAQGNRLRRLIENLLDSTSLENGTLRVAIGPVSLEPAIRRVVDAQMTGRVTIEVPPDLPEVSADEGRLEQVLTNLIDNAVKHSDGTEEVLVEAARVNGNQVEVSVTDHGPGIDPAFLPRLFDAFSQAETAPERHTGGVGIGLHIARGLIEAMQGAIGVETHPGTGSRFWFRLRTVSAS